MRVAAFDLGSNSFLCLVVEKNSTGNTTVLYDSFEVVRLAQGIDKTGILHKDALMRAEACLTKFTSEITDFNVDSKKAIATSAARDAKNSQLLFDILNKLGIELEIVSGEREAQLSFLGAVDEEESSEVLLLDIGGGSTEFNFFQKQSLVSKSLNLGAVRLLEKFFTSDELQSSEVSLAQEFCQQILCKHLLIEQKFKKIVAVAGTPTTLAQIHLGLTEFNSDKINGLKLGIDDIERCFLKLLSCTLEQRKNITGLDPRRADTIPIGTLILLECMKYLSVDEISVSTKGVRYGLAKEMLA